MGTITLPNVPATSDITTKVRLKYGGMPIDFRTLTDIKAWVYSDAQKALAGRCVTTIEGEEGEVLSCLYTATKPQYLGPNRIIVQAKYHGQTNTYDKLAFNIVRRLGDVATEVIEVEDNDAEVAIEVDVTIEITEVSAGLLDRGIAAAFDAADKAEHAASLVPLQVLQDCEIATEEAQAATEAADEAAEHATPYIGENGHWWRWSKEAGEYVDTGEVAQGPKGDTPTWDDFTEEEQEEITSSAAESLAENKLNDQDLALSEGGKIQFADRAFDAQQPNGMGYVILRKNKAFAEQVTETNTIYEIRYPFALSSNFTIPAGCVLRFNGGSISGYTLNGTNTKIEAGIVPIFSGITIAGTWLVADIHSEWFADITQTNKVFNLFSLCNNSLHNRVTISEDCNVAIDTTATPSKYTNGKVILLDGQKDIDIILNGSLKLSANSYIGYRIISLSNCSSITIEGSGSIIGDRDSHDYTTTTAEGSSTVSTHEFGHGIYIFNSSRDITVKGVKVYQCTGDGIDVLSADVRIEGVELYDNRRQGISVGDYGERVIIEDFNIHDIDGTAPKAAIDIEPNGTNVVRNIIIRNGQVSKCTHAVAIAGPASAKTIRNVEVSNISVKNFNTTNAVFYVQGGTNVRFSGIRFENIAQADSTVDRLKVLFQVYYSDKVEISNIKAVDSISMPSFISGREASAKMENCLFDNSSVSNGQFLYMDVDDFDFDLVNSNIKSAKFIFYNPKIPSFRIVGCTLTMNFNLQSWNGSTVEKNGIVEGCTFAPSGTCNYSNTVFRRNIITANFQLTGQNVIIEDNIFNTNCGLWFNTSKNCSFERNKMTFTAVSSYCVNLIGTNKNILIKSNFIDISGVSSRIQSVFYTRGEQIEISNNLLVIGDRLTNFVIIPSTAVALSFKNNSVDGTPAVKYFSTDGGVFPIYRGYEYTLNVGATANRPALTSAEPEVGFLYFDTSLGKPIFWNGTAWVDATGTTV